MKLFQKHQIIGKMESDDLFYVFDNVHDWLCNCNLGNGLADFLCHFSDNERGMGEPEPSIFIEYANRHLRKKTSLEEIFKILHYHYLGQESSKKVKNKTFVLAEDGFLSEADPILNRIVELRNAYITEYNCLNKANVDLIDIEVAIAHAIPQIRIFPDGKDAFDMGCILNVDVKIKGDKRDYTTSLIDQEILSLTFALMSAYNKFGIYSETNYCIKTELLDKYFNNGDPNYQPGLNAGFYLGGIPQFQYPQLATINFEFNVPDKNIAIVTKIIKPDFPTLKEDELKILVLQYIAMYKKISIPTSFGIRELTGFEAMNFYSSVVMRIGGPFYPDIKSPKVQYSIFWELANFYRIRKDMLAENYQQLLDPKYKDYQNIRNRAKIIKAYMLDLLRVYQAYRKEINLKKRSIN
jgi:hypothetical protein